MNKRATQQSPPRLLAVAALLAATLALIPLIYLLVRASSAGLEGIVELLSRPRIAMLTLNTVALGASVTFAAVLMGVPSAFVLSRVRLRGRGWWMMVAAAPLAIPSYLTAYGLLAIFPSMQGFWASWLVLTMVSVPYVTLPVATMLRYSSTDLEDVARMLGRTPWRARFAGSWHQIRAATLAGALLAFLYAIADFGGVALFRFQVLTTAIQEAYGSSYDRAYASILSLILVALAIVIVTGERLARGRASRTVVSTARRGKTRLIPFAPGRIPLLVVLISPALIAVVLPVVFIVQRMITSDALAVLDVNRLLAATGTTVGLSMLGALIAIACAAPIAVISAKYRTKLSRVIDTVGHLPLALPGIVVGLALVLFSLTVVPALYQTIYLLAFAYAVLYMPKAIGSIRSRVASIPDSLGDVATTLGYRPSQRLRTVYGRLARPGFILGGLLVAVAAMKELPATLLLRPTGVDTLATVMWSRTDVAQYGAGAPYALALIIVASIPAFILSRTDRTNGQVT